MIAMSREHFLRWLKHKLDGTDGGQTYRSYQDAWDALERGDKILLQEGGKRTLLGFDTETGAPYEEPAEGIVYAPVRIQGCKGGTVNLDGSVDHGASTREREQERALRYAQESVACPR